MPPRAQVIEQDDTGWTEEWKKKLYEEEGSQPEVGRRSGRVCSWTEFGGLGTWQRGCRIKAFSGILLTVGDIFG